MISPEIANLSQKLGTFIVTGDRREVRFNCPFCEKNGKTRDISYHLYVHNHRDRHYGNYICHKCNTRGRGIRSLTSRVGLNFAGNPIPINILEQVEAYLFPEPDVKLIAKEIPLPEGSVPLTDSYTLAWEYCLKRNLLPDDIVHYDLHLGGGKQAWRIIIPNPIRTGGYDFWQGRWYHPFEKNNVKYMSPTNAYKSVTLFNQARIDCAKQVIICEGPFSAMLAGRNSIATYGKYISPKQVELLIKMNAPEYVVALDADARIESFALANTLSSVGKNVKVLLFNGTEDPAEVGEEGIQKMLKYTEEYSVWETAFIKQIEMLAL